MRTSLRFAFLWRRRRQIEMTCAYRAGASGTRHRSTFGLRFLCFEKETESIEVGEKKAADERRAANFPSRSAINSSAAIHLGAFIIKNRYLLTLTQFRHLIS